MERTECGSAVEDHMWSTWIDPSTVEWLLEEEEGTIASETFELKYIKCSRCGITAAEYRKTSFRGSDQVPS